MEYSFEKLRVWQEGKNLVIIIYDLTKKFPSTETHGFTSQMRRASLSIPSNIAEGSSRVSDKDQARFYSIAYSSLIELLNKVIIAEELDFITTNELETTRDKIEYVSNMLNSLKKSLKK